jgi:23S rRNA (pseudouridine1915-N3)-methyltransferase
MKITVVTVGKLKEKYLLDGIKEYSKRLSKYTQLELIEVKDEHAPESLSEKDKNIVKNKEADRINAKLKDSYLISLAIEGKQIGSEKLAAKIEDIKTYHDSHITFLIGGSLGLADSLKKKSNFLLSFSQMTFPHQLMKLILLEQIYRSFRINNNEPYHK